MKIALLIHNVVHSLLGGTCAPLLSPLTKHVKICFGLKIFVKLDI